MSRIGHNEFKNHIPFDPVPGSTEYTSASAEARTGERSSPVYKENKVENKIDLQVNKKYYIQYIRRYDFQDFHECKKWECDCENINIDLGNYKDGESEPVKCSECGKELRNLINDKRYHDKIENMRRMKVKTKYIKFIILFMKMKAKKFFTQPQGLLMREIIEREWNVIKENQDILEIYNCCY